MNRAEELMRKLTEAHEDFSARDYFMGKLGALADRGFQEGHIYPGDGGESMFLDLLPFRVWVSTTHGGQVVNVSAEHDDRMERTNINKWSYPIEELDAALAQADEVIQVINETPGESFWEKHQAIWQKLKAMGKAPVAEAVPADAPPEETFDPRDYVLGSTAGDTVKGLGYEKFGDSDSYTKMLVNDVKGAHYLTVYGADYRADPDHVIVEYQRHNPMLGFTFPWSALVNNNDLRKLLPVLESAIKSAYEQHMPDPELKQALTALVK